jgi:lipoprotein NlpI
VRFPLRSKDAKLPALPLISGGNLDAAEKLLKQALEQMQALGMTWQIAETNFDLARLESKRGNLAEAESRYAIALSEAIIGTAIAHFL